MKSVKITRACVMALLTAVLMMAPGCAGEDEDGLITIEVYSQASNNFGIQPGWFGKIVRDKFNIQLNIFSPQVAGDGKALFQTRVASGHLGDIVILDNADFLDCVKAGLIMDISEVIGDYENLMAYDHQIQTFNAEIPGAGGKLYGIPCQMTDTSPTSYTPLNVFSSPMVPWDYYTGIGAPRLRNLDDLLDALELMQKTYPVNAHGDPNYAISLWPDWDVTSNENVNQTVKWYGVEVASGYPQSSVLLDTNNNMKSLVDDDGEYLKLLRFFYKANQRGIVDPDSGTQQWEQVWNKTRYKRVFLLWYSWHPNAWNTTDRGNARENYMPIPVDDMFFFQDGDSYYGDGRVFGIGSKVSPAKRERIMQFLDWMASPEGLEYLHAGIKDFYHKDHEDGGHVRILESTTDVIVPQELGGGKYDDGTSWLNQSIVAAVTVNPATGYPYDWKLWPAEIEKAKTTDMKEWQEMFNAESQTDYLLQHGQIGIVPRVNVVLPSDPTEIQLIRSQCATITRDFSWRCIFARDDGEFDRLWSTMKTQLNGFGWDRLVAYDMDKFQAVVDIRNELAETSR